MQNNIILVIFLTLISFNVKANKNIFLMLETADSCDILHPIDSFFLRKRTDIIQMIPDSFYSECTNMFVVEQYDFLFKKYEMYCFSENSNYHFSIKEDTLFVEPFEPIHFDVNKKSTKWDINTCIKDTFMYDYKKAAYWAENSSQVLLDDHTRLICTLIEENENISYCDRLVFYEGWIKKRLWDIYEKKWVPYL